MDSRQSENHSTVNKSICLESLADNINNNIPVLFKSKLELLSEEIELSSVDENISTNSECSSDISKTCSSRRKQYAPKLGFPLREFFQSRSFYEDNKPTVVDKLISKNKFALIDGNMKKVKRKTLKEVVNNVNGQRVTSNSTSQNGRKHLQNKKLVAGKVGLKNVALQNCKKAPINDKQNKDKNQKTGINNMRGVKVNAMNTFRSKIKQAKVDKSLKPKPSHDDKRKKKVNKNVQNRPNGTYITRSGVKNFKNWKVEMLADRTRRKRNLKTKMSAVEKKKEADVSTQNISCLTTIATSDTKMDDKVKFSVNKDKIEEEKSSKKSDTKLPQQISEKSKRKCNMLSINKKSLKSRNSICTNIENNAASFRPTALKRLNMSDKEKSEKCKKLKKIKCSEEQLNKSHTDFEKVANETVKNVSDENLCETLLSNSSVSEKIDDGEFRTALETSQLSEISLCNYTLNEAQRKTLINPIEKSYANDTSNSILIEKVSEEEISTNDIITDSVVTDMRHINNDQLKPEYIDLDNIDQSITSNNNISENCLDCVMKNVDLSSTAENKLNSFNIDGDSVIDLCYEEQENICDNTSEHTYVKEDDNIQLPAEECEDNDIKESILNALGLQSLQKVKSQKNTDNYTGTLKAVIKLHKTSDKDKGYRKMEMKPTTTESVTNKFKEAESMNNVNYASKQLNEYNNVSYIEDSRIQPNINTTTDCRQSEFDHTAVGRLGEYLMKINSITLKDKTKYTTSLVVPEKSSSFSIHPNRLCSDVCKYCFGKFGSLDTPCHVAQLKNPERQEKILSCEPNLKIDTCLCDACYRYVDRKANRPPSKRKAMRHSTPLSQRNVCSVQGCTQIARHSVKRKWLLRLQRKVSKLSFDIRKTGSRLFFGLCSQHYFLVDFYTVCGICKKRLNKNHTYSVGTELDALNRALMEDNFPVELTDTVLLCKLCHYYSSFRLKYGKPSTMSDDHKQHYQNFRRKILRTYNVHVNENEDIFESSRKQDTSSSSSSSSSTDSSSISSSSSSGMSHNNDIICEENNETITISDDECMEDLSHTNKMSENRDEKEEPRRSYPIGFTNIANLLETECGEKRRESNSTTRIQVKFGNLNIGKLSNLNIGQDSRNEVKHTQQCPPRQAELPLEADFNFENCASQNKNWEKCVSTIQFDKSTKKLWQDLQKPYGNQSSFMRHLIILEKYWRSGALVLSDTADTSAVKYINSVKNRVQSLENNSGSKSSNSELGESKTDKNWVPTDLNIPPLKVLNSTTSLASSNYRCGNPPPLLKVSSMPNQYTVVKAPSSLYHIKQTDIKNFKGLKCLKPFNNTNSNYGKKVYLNTSQVKNIIPVTLQQFREINNKHFLEMTKSSANPHVINLQYFKKSLPPVTIDSTSLVPDATAITKSQLNNVVVSSESPINVTKFPKTLTVTPVSESLRDNSGTHIPAVFLAGEKPSISVFRDVKD